MAIIRAYPLRFDSAITRSQVEAALDSLPQGDGITPHAIRGLFEDGKLVIVELHIDDPVTRERIDLGRSRLSLALRNATALIPRRTGLEGDAPEELFEMELGKISTGSTSGGFLADTLNDLLRSGALIAGVVLGGLFLVAVARR